MYSNFHTSEYWTREIVPVLHVFCAEKAKIQTGTCFLIEIFESIRQIKTSSCFSVWNNIPFLVK